MIKYFQYSIAILFITLIISCKSISKYTIDDKPLVKTDSSLYGIWKAVEDTDKANYILVQSPYDLFHYVDWWYHLDSIKKRSYFDEKFLADPERVRMAFHKDETMYSEAYNDFIGNKDYYYHITRMGMHGKTPHYKQWSVFVSKVNNTIFLNIPYRYVPSKDGHYLSGQTKQGFFFVRLVKITAAYDTITTAIISDTTLMHLTNSKEVRNRVAKNINNPAFYSDTLHFYKVSGYHLSLEESVSKAN